MVVCRWSEVIRREVCCETLHRTDGYKLIKVLLHLVQCSISILIIQLYFTMTTPVTKDNAGRPCVPCLIDGKPVIQSSQASFPVISAASQGIIHYGQTASINIAVQAVDSAAATFKTYKKTSVVERRRLLLRAADLFEAKLEEAMTRQISETSCDENWARLNTKHMAAASREAAGVLETALTGEMPPSQMGFHQLVYKEAVGPVLLIMP